MSVLAKCLHTGEMYEFESLKECSDNLNISYYSLKRIIKDGKVFTIRDREDVLYVIESKKVIAVTLVPAWETDMSSHDFVSNYKAINFLGVSLSYYYRIMGQTPLEEPSETLFKDRLGMPYMAIWHRKQEFKLNKNKKENDKDETNV